MSWDFRNEYHETYCYVSCVIVAARKRATTITNSLIPDMGKCNLKQNRTRPLNDYQQFTSSDKIAVTENIVYNREREGITHIYLLFE